MRRITVSRRAERDLRHIGRGAELQRLRSALEALASGTANLDIKALQGRSPWLRLRTGDYRVLFRVIEGETDPDGEILVARIVHRRDLERASATVE